MRQGVCTFIGFVVHSTAVDWIEGIPLSLLQSASQGVRYIVFDNPVNFLQAAGMPRTQSMLTGTMFPVTCLAFSVHWLHMQLLLFLVAGLHLACIVEEVGASLFPA